ncbi:porin family protein [Leeuwenhoekiella marinoflava]|uniref:Outer membrane protein with beta-barrel domain n=2 Tax=Leeuwenhoekiella marinoflava TaxID=988 RepID=A0A4Q0PM00_9FLAO|nr:porin family protein [Leeuwenhoekiella marinoflava]RXG30750.1 outer membrane protein with beta-barrel domain [Leeuwenhoekiella marinoflava]SHF17711.1 Outer membrane protein beta-barrel domain-containing protein [Leeuwenhoekiella marinoflava DSM 3653]
MKKLFFTAILVFGTTSLIQAQSELAFGIKGGVNFSNLTGDGVDGFNDDNARTSFNLGAVLEIPVTERFAVQPEVFYSGQGFDLVQRDDAQDTEFQLNYINVPVLAKIYLVQGLYLEAGPQVGFLVDSKIDGPNATIGLDEDNFNDIDFAGAVGVGYKFNGGLFLNARYTQGFSDVYDSGEGNGFDAKNGVFAASVGFSFN